MATKIIGGGPHMPSFIVGLLLGILATVAYYHFNPAPAAPAAQTIEMQRPG